MITSDDVRVPTAASERRRLRLLATLGPLAVIVCAVVWNVGATVLDGSSVDQSSGSWGYAFASGIFTFVVGAPLLILVTVTTLVAQFVPAAARGALTAGVVVCALAGFVLGVYGLVAALTGRYTGDTVFGVITVAACFVLLAPAWFAWESVVRR